MNFKPVFRSIAAIALLLAAGEARATTMYYSVDSSTGGPISLNELSNSFDSLTDQETFNYQAVNSSGETFSDVKYLNDFVLDLTPYPSAGIPMSYNTGTQTWSDSDPYDHSWQYTISPTNTIPMDDTNLPLTYTNYGATASIGATDAAPYVDVGPIGAFGSVDFSEVATLSPGSYLFDAAGAFVAPVPEPSTFVLFGAGAVGALFFVGLRRRSAVV